MQSASNSINQTKTFESLLDNCDSHQIETEGVSISKLYNDNESPDCPFPNVKTTTINCTIGVIQEDDREDDEEEDDDYNSLYDESFGRSFYWDTSSQLTSSPEEDPDEQLDNHHSKVIDHTFAAHVYQVLRRNTHQFLSTEDINGDSSYSPAFTSDDSFPSNFEAEQEPVDSEEISQHNDMVSNTTRTKHLYHNLQSSIYNEVLESFQIIDNIGDFPSIKEMTFDTIPETPNTAVSSVFSHHQQTPRSATSSKFTNVDDEFDSHDDNDDDLNNLKLFQKKPPTGSRLLRKLSRTFSSSSIASKQSQSALEEPYKAPETHFRLKESPSFRKLRHRFSIASFQDKSEDQLYVPKQRHATREKNSMAALQREAAVVSSTKSGQLTGNSSKTIPLRSVANLQNSQLTKKCASNLRSIEQTIGPDGAGSDADYLEFKRKYLM